MLDKEIETYYPKSKQHWRKWLEKNHNHKQAVWVIFYKKKLNKPTLTWSEAVDEALCFGWIDSVKKTLDDERAIQFFSKRKPKSTWSKINKEKVQRLIEANKMTQAGLDCIEVAKENGCWKMLDSAENLIIPKDLAAELRSKGKAMEYFLSLSNSTRKAMLQWLIFAKRAETRQKRITEIAALAEQNRRPKQF